MKKAHSSQSAAIFARAIPLSFVTARAGDRDDYGADKVVGSTVFDVDKDLAPLMGEPDHFNYPWKIVTVRVGFAEPKLSLIC